MYSIVDGIVYYTVDGAAVMYGMETRDYIQTGATIQFRNETFNLTNEVYELNDTYTGSLNYSQDNAGVSVNYVNGVHTVDVTGLTSTFINGRTFKLKNGVWALYQPYAPGNLSIADNSAAIQGLIALVHDLKGQVDAIKDDTDNNTIDISDLSNQISSLDDRVTTLEGP